MFADDDEVFTSIQALPDSDVLIAQATNDGFALKQFYKTETNSREIHYENYGSWSSESGIIDERESKIISRRRGNLRGKLITSSYVHLDKNSKNHLTDFVDKNVDSIMKLNYLAINDVLDKMNATKKEIFQMTWGYFNERTKKWSGMVGDIVHKGAEIGGDFKWRLRKKMMKSYFPQELRSLSNLTDCHIWTFCRLTPAHKARLCFVHLNCPRVSL
jgi:hypothetical protein